MSVVNELDMGVVDTAVRDGTAAGGRMAAYWGMLMEAGIPLPVAGGLVMQYQAALLGHLMPVPPQLVEVRHGSVEDGGEW